MKILRHEHVRMDRKLKTNFGDFWGECGGEPTADPRFLQNPPGGKAPGPVGIETLQTGQPRRRYELMDKMRGEMAEKLKPFAVV